MEVDTGDYWGVIQLHYGFCDPFKHAHDHDGPLGSHAPLDYISRCRTIFFKHVNLTHKLVNTNAAFTLCNQH